MLFVFACFVCALGFEFSEMRGNKCYLCLCVLFVHWHLNSKKSGTTPRYVLVAVQSWSSAGLLALPGPHKQKWHLEFKTQEFDI